MEKIFNAASLPQAVIAMVPHIIQTCRACRAWALSGPDVTPSVELVDKQNVEVEADILLYKTFKVWHMIDRADRWHAGCQIASKHHLELQEAIDKCWLRIFGPFKILIIDGEKGIEKKPKHS